MKQVAKVIIIDGDDNYLLMKRSDHPHFPNDPDLPGGTIEPGENHLDALLREVIEEAGIVLNPNEIEHLFTGNQYSAHQTIYHLYVARVPRRPDVKISWEHASFDWVNRDAFLKEAQNAADTYMTMVYEVMRRDRLMDS